MRLCLYIVGQAVGAVADEHGNYADWFAAAVPAGQPRLECVSALAGEHPSPADYAALIVSGSPSSLRVPEPWMDDAADTVTRFADAGAPVLGVCFGHQLIAQAFGGRVVKAAVGRQLSSQTITLTERGAGDPLFAGLPQTFQANLAHEDEIELDGDALDVLAHGPHSVNAIAVGDAVRGVQFHPEFTGSIMAAYVEQRADELGTRAAALVERAGDTPEAMAVIGNFITEFAARA